MQSSPQLHFPVFPSQDHPLLWDLSSWLIFSHHLRSQNQSFQDPTFISFQFCFTLLLDMSSSYSVSFLHKERQERQYLISRFPERQNRDYGGEEIIRDVIQDNFQSWSRRLVFRPQAPHNEWKESHLDTPSWNSRTPKTREDPESWQKRTNEEWKLKHLCALRDNRAMLQSLKENQSEPKLCTQTAINP